MGAATVTAEPAESSTALRAAAPVERGGRGAWRVLTPSQALGLRHQGTSCSPGFARTKTVTGRERGRAGKQGACCCGLSRDLHPQKGTQRGKAERWARRSPGVMSESTWSGYRAPEASEGRVLSADVMTPVSSLLPGCWSSPRTRVSGGWQLEPMPQAPGCEEGFLEETSRST